jgi:hypothetical protein
MLLGVGTQSNNTPASTVKTYYADADDSFTTLYNGTYYSASNLAYGSFLDSGSNWFNFPLALTAETSSYYTPASTTAFSATIISATGGNQSSISFTIGNASTLLASGNVAFSDVGAEWDSAWDWGLPFFFGRTVYIGFNGRSTPLGTGPLWGF